MKAFIPIIEGNKIKHIWDTRYEDQVDITDGTGVFASFAYTLKSQDITRADKPEFVPYIDNKGEYEFVEHRDHEMVFCNTEFKTSLSLQNHDDKIVMALESNADVISAFGVELSLNFMSKKNGDWETQFLVSSPYYSMDDNHYFCYFTRPDGNHIVIIVNSPIDGYRVEYSPYLCGHYIRGFQFLSQFDKAYNRPLRKNKKLELHIIPVASYEEAVVKASKLWQVPAVLYDRSSDIKGRKIPFRIIGKCDRIEFMDQNEHKKVNSLNINETSVIPESYGMHRIIPYQDGVRGLDATVFAHDDWKSMYVRASNEVIQHRNCILGTTKEGRTVWKPPFLSYRGIEDFNLCEHAMWSWAALRCIRLFGEQGELKEDIKNHISIITASETEIQLNACTILPEQGYRTKNSSRIQEIYNGVNILLDAYRVFHDKSYLEYAVETLQNCLQRDMDENGGIYRHGSDGETEECADYTTVTGIVIPVVDVAVILKELRDERYLQFEIAAEKIADYVVKRGLSFPTEGGKQEEVNEEREEGSMSCSVLTVLYVAWHIKKKEKYISFAKQILKIHDAYSVYTPHPVLFRSSLRWWETIWEGNSDGPAICYGHAWTIWRAEAEYYYGLMQYDDERLLDSYNGFMSNFSKVAENGDMSAIYQYEAISSGALATNGLGVDFTDTSGFPRRSDDTLSRYVFARAFDSWFTTTAIVKVGNEITVLNGILENGVLHTDAPAFAILYIGHIYGDIKIKADCNLRIICSQQIKVILGDITKKSETGISLNPINGEMEISVETYTTTH